MYDVRNIPMADAPRFIGSQVELPGSARKTEVFTLTAADFCFDSVVLGLNVVEVRLAATRRVKLWSLQTKVGHTKCGGCCRKDRDHLYRLVPAAQLAGNIGWFVFLEGGTSVGPHRLLSAEQSDDGQVTIKFSAEEALAPLDRRIAVRTGATLATAA